MDDNALQRHMQLHACVLWVIFCHTNLSLEKIQRKKLEEDDKFLQERKLVNRISTQGRQTQADLPQSAKPSGDKASFASDILIRFFTNLLISARGIVYLPVIAKTLSAADYGIWTQMTVTLALVTPFLTLRLETACVRYLSSKKGREVARDFFAMLAVVGGTVALVGLIILMLRRPFSLFLFDDSSLASLIGFLVILIASRIVFKFLHSYYRTFRRMMAYSLIQVVQIALELGLLFVFVVTLSWAIPGAVLSIALAEAALVLVMLIDILRREGFPSGFSWKSIWPYLKYSLPLVPSTALYWVVNSSDRYVIVHFLNLEQVAIYSATYQLAQLATFFISPIAFVLFPTISKQWESGQKNLTRNYIRGASRYYLMLAVPAAHNF